MRSARLLLLLANLALIAAWLGKFQPQRPHLVRRPLSRTTGRCGTAARLGR